MNRMRVVCWVVAAFLVAACGSSGGGNGGTSSYSGKTIKLGAVLSITGAGGKRHDVEVKLRASNMPTMEQAMVVPAVRSRRPDGE